MDGVLVVLLLIVPAFTSPDPEGCITRREYAYLQRRVDAIESMQLKTGRAGGVSFTATLTTSSQLKGNATIVFDNVLLNTAEAYNSSNGVFTALFYGIHFFSATITADHHTAITAGVAKDGRVVASMSSCGDGQGSASITLNLYPGDRVWVQADQNAPGYLRAQSGWNVFTGFQLNSVIERNLSGTSLGGS